jgi:hypothetical protein
VKKKLPFQNLGVKGWQNLVLFALFVYYLIQIGLALYVNDLFNTLGSDYLGFWTTGYIANTQGYDRIYDADLVSRIQKPYHESSETDNVYAPILTAFFPAFGLPFQALALLKPGPSFAIWSLLNIVILVAYLNFFIRDMPQKRPSSGEVVLLIISYPVFQNIFWGQINIWLLVCMGEFMRATKHGRFFIGGLWLAGMLAKPQTLILLIPALILKRYWGQIAGFATGMFSILAISLFLSGAQGLKELLDVWLGFASGIPTNAPEHMVNWRMVMVQISAIVSVEVGWAVAIVGIFFTLLVGLLALHKSIIISSVEFPVILFGLMAATALTTWHSHIHMMLVLLPLLTYLSAQNKVPMKLVRYWTFGAPIALAATYFHLLLVKYGFLTEPEYDRLILGLWGLTFNLAALAWAIKTASRPSNPRK